MDAVFLAGLVFSEGVGRILVIGEVYLNLALLGPLLLFPLPLLLLTVSLIAIGVLAGIILVLILVDDCALHGGVAIAAMVDVVTADLNGLLGVVVAIDDDLLVESVVAVLLVEEVLAFPCDEDGQEHIDDADDDDVQDGVEQGQETAILPNDVEADEESGGLSDQAEEGVDVEHPELGDVLEAGAHAVELEETSEHDHFELVVESSREHHHEGVEALVGGGVQPVLEAAVVQQQHGLHQQSQ